MGFIVTIILFFLLWAKQLTDTRRIHGINLYNTFIVYWLIIVFLGTFQLYGLYEISFDVYFLVVVGSIAFSLGYNLYNKGNAKFKYVKIILPPKEYISFRWTYYLLLIAAVCIVIKQVVLLLPIIIASGMSDARGELQVDDLLVLGGGWDILLAYFAKPFIKASMIVYIVNLFHNKVELKKVLLILLLVVVYFLSEGGRAVIMDLFFAFCYLLYTNRRCLSHKTISIMKKTIMVIASLPVLATFERGSDVFFAIYTYYCGSLQFLSQALQLKVAYFEDHLWGMACFQGFVKPFTGLLQLLGIAKPQVVQDASDFIIDAQTTVYDIAPNCEMNYFYTTFGYAYKDGGYIGNFILHVIFGLLCKYIDIKSFVYSKSVRWVAIKTTFFYCILYTMSYYPFGMYLHAMTLIYIMIITTNWFANKHTKVIQA